MKALTIKQPWASLIAHGIKDIENRTWPTKFRGHIFIHCSAPKKFNVDLTDEQTIQALPVLKTAIEGEMPFGAIIGLVEIIDCVTHHPSIWAEVNISGGKPIYNWVLANPVLFPKPISIKGALSFWEPNLSVCNYCLEWCKNLHDGFGCKECAEKHGKSK